MQILKGRGKKDLAILSAVSDQETTRSNFWIDTKRPARHRRYDRVRYSKSTLTAGLRPNFSSSIVADLIPKAELRSSPTIGRDGGKQMGALDRQVATSALRSLTARRLPSVAKFGDQQMILARDDHCQSRCKIHLRHATTQ